MNNNTNKTTLSRYPRRNKSRIINQEVSDNNIQKDSQKLKAQETQKPQSKETPKPGVSRKGHQQM